MKIEHFEFIVDRAIVKRKNPKNRHELIAIDGLYKVTAQFNDGKKMYKTAIVVEPEQFEIVMDEITKRVLAELKNVRES